MVELKSTQSQKLDRILRVFNNALDNNPYMLPKMTSPPTVAVSTSTDASLAAEVPMVTSNALTSAASNRIAWYGGKLTVASGSHVGLPVASASPGSGTGYNAGSVTSDMVLLNGAFEVETDSDVIEFRIYGKNDKGVMFQVDGQYVSKTRTDFTSASTVDHFFKLTFASRKVRRIRVMLCTTTSVGVSLVRGIRVSASCTFWKPEQDHVLKCGWAGDSYSEGHPYALAYPNGAWSTLAGELLGIRDLRQTANGGTGYVVAGTRQKLAGQIPYWLTDQGPWDLMVWAHGYNDAVSGQQASVQAEVTACIELVRAEYADLPIVILGAQTGVLNNSAAVLAVEAAIQAAVTAAADPFIKFAPVSSDYAPWMSGTGYVGATNASGNTDVYIGADAVHPSYPAGHEYLAFRAATAIRTAVQSMAA